MASASCRSTSALARRGRPLIILRHAAFGHGSPVAASKGEATDGDSHGRDKTWDKNRGNLVPGFVLTKGWKGGAPGGTGSALPSDEHPEKTMTIITRRADRSAPLGAALLLSATLLVLSPNFSRQPLPQQDPSRAIELLLRRFDKNFDGKVDRDEYPRARRSFRRFDRDGFISSRTSKRAPMRRPPPGPPRSSDAPHRGGGRVLRDPGPARSWPRSATPATPRLPVSAPAWRVDSPRAS